MKTQTFPDAILALADGTILKDLSFGAPITVTGEVVLNTGMTGYQGILTAPSHQGQPVTMTVPHIGNVGVKPQDEEYRRPRAAGFIVREISRVVSNWRADGYLPDCLKENQLPGLTERDTRALVRHILTQGAMMGTVSSDPGQSAADLVELARAAPDMNRRDLASEVTCDGHYTRGAGVTSSWYAGFQATDSGHYHVVAYDFGINHNILRLLASAGCRVTVVPASTSAAQVLALQPDGVFLSNGPGDPAAVTYAISEVRALADSGVLLFGIYLGHQILGLALGGMTPKLKFGHRNGNQPVRAKNTGAVSIASHNHGFSVTGGSLPDNVEVSHVNLNHDCIEALRHRQKPIFSIQYHPESSPGPHDALSFFHDFVGMMAAAKTRQK